MNHKELELFNGKPTDLLNCYIKDVKQQPKFRLTYEKLMKIHHTLEDDDAQKLIDLYLNIIKDYKTVPIAYMSLGHLLRLRGQEEEAIHYYHQCSKTQSLVNKQKLLENNDNEFEPGQPTFIIIGSMKCGTTSLYDYLVQHPKIEPAIKKEIHFFDVNNFFKNGLDWYCAHFPTLTKGHISGEASPNYLVHMKVAKRLVKTFPNIKLILLIRNPIDRAISHYNHVLRVKPNCENRSFESAVKEEMTMIKSELPSIIHDIQHKDLKDQKEKYGHGYLLRGLYHLFIEQWMQFFPKEQFLIIRTEDLSQNPNHIMSQVFDFLELPNHQPIQYSMRNKGNYSSDIDSSLIAELYDFYRPHNQKLEDFLGRKFNWEPESYNSIK